MLQTNLDHITNDADFKSTIESNENVMICCGRMGPMCTPVYSAMEYLGPRYENVTFRDMAFDSAVANNIRALPEVQKFKGLPFTVYFKNGKVVRATTSLQSPEQITDILDKSFA